MLLLQLNGNWTILGKVFLNIPHFILLTFSGSPSYLVCFAVGDFIEVDDGQVDGIPIKVTIVSEYVYHSVY